MPLWDRGESTGSDFFVQIGGFDAQCVERSRWKHMRIGSLDGRLDLSRGVIGVHAYSGHDCVVP